MMKIGLATAEFKNNDTIGNIKTIKQYMKEAQIEQVDLLLFGESFLQGFDSLTWEPENDVAIALAKDDKQIQELRNYCQALRVALGFGYMEKCGNKFYCSYLIFDHNGCELTNYRRVSTGWRYPHVDTNFCQEGNQLSVFEYGGRKFTIGLCGDFWDDQLVAKIPVDTEVVLWPNFRTIEKEVWVATEFDEYVERAKSLAKNVFFVNSICRDEKAVGHGGAFAVINGELKHQQILDKAGILTLGI